MFSCFSSWQGSVFSDFSLVLITLHHGTGMPLSDVLYTFKKPGNVSPRTHWVFAYFRSLLQSTTTILGGPHRHAYPNTHAISWCFSVLSSTGIMVLGQRPAYAQGYCALLPFSSPLLLASSISKQAAHYSWEWGTVSRVFSQSLLWGNFISPC